SLHIPWVVQNANSGCVWMTFLNSPVSQTVLFGDVVESFVQQFSAVWKQTEAIKHILPQWTAAASTQPPAAAHQSAYRQGHSHPPLSAQPRLLTHPPLTVQPGKCCTRHPDHAFDCHRAPPSQVLVFYLTLQVHLWFLCSGHPVHLSEGWRWSCLAKDTIEPVPPADMKAGSISVQGLSLLAVAVSPHLHESHGACHVPMREQGIRILNYPDDWLILEHSRDQLCKHRDLVLSHLS
ncbi:hypothetical protein M9458_025302, partial [Cirrhinus mrigala]